MEFIHTKNQVLRNNGGALKIKLVSANFIGSYDTRKHNVFGAVNLKGRVDASKHSQRSCR